MARRKQYTDRPGRGEDITQAALMLACNQYPYGQVCHYPVCYIHSILVCKTLAIDGRYLLEHPCFTL